MKTIQQVPLQQIDVTDETFSVNFMPDLEKLRSSIKEVGLIEPVVLKKKNQGYQIVCGFRRIRLALGTGNSGDRGQGFRGEGMRRRRVVLHLPP